MSDEDALLSAIAAHPDEDTPRLVYADWLDEHGRHVRAEFLRVQVEVARVETLPRILLNRHVDVFIRQQELIDHHRDELLGPLAVLPKNAKVEFDRGFVSELTLTCEQFETLHASLARVLPLPRVTVEDVVERIRALLVDASRADLPRHLVTAIRTKENKAGEDDALIDAGQVAAHLIDPNQVWNRLEVLDISGCRLGAFVFDPLVTPTAFPALRDLDASVNDLTDIDVDALLDKGLPRQLTRLILGGNPLTSSAAIDLARRWPTGADDKLEYLNLKFTGIGQPGQQALLRRFGGRIDLF